ncbi:MAG TPA: GNAT family N-acetyltransferase [Acidimicrobiia bacterium]|jgi:predicted acetyltransferase
MQVELVEPDVRFEGSYRDAMAEFIAEGRAEELGTLANHASFADFVRELVDWSQGLGLPAGWVPGSTYWLVDGDRFLGRVQIRHHLTADLRLRGGHVGYAIRPTARRHGYGRMGLAMALRPCLDLQLASILVTCDTTNEGSRRIIEGNGGVLEDVVEVPGRRVGTMRFWIDVVAQLSTDRP